MMRVWLGVTVLAAFGCVSPNTVVCENGRTCPGDMRCDDVHGVCVVPDQLQTCVGAPDGDECLIGGSGAGFCRDAVCLAATCGDGFKRGNEECDGDELGGTTCETLGFYETSPLTCNDACSFDTSQCLGSCGDGRVSGPELCDDGPPQLSCVDLGFGAGFLDCNQCAPLTKGCRFIDWQTFATSQAVNDVHGTGDQDVYVVGGGQVLRFTNSSWSPVDLSMCVATADNVDFGAVWSFGNGNAIIGGADIGLGAAIAIHLTPTGCTKKVVSASGGGVFDLWAADANNVYAVGAGMGVYRYDGTSWAVHDTALGGRRIWGSGTNDIYTAGNSPVPLRHYNGSWATVTVPGIAVPYSVWGTSATDVYVGGRVDQMSAVARVARFNGSGWTTILDNASSDVRVGATIDGRVFAADAAGLYVYDGTTWLDLQLPGSTSLRQIWIAPDSGKLVIAANSPLVRIYPGALMSTDPLQAAGVTRMYVTAPDRAYAAGTANDFDLVGGNMWSIDSPPITVKDIWIDAAGDMYAISPNDGIFKRANFVWPAATSPTIALQNGISLWGASESDLWISTDVNGTTVEMRHWSGSALDTLCATCTRPSNEQNHQLWGTAGNNVFAWGYDSNTDGGFLIRWDGLAWTAQTLPSNTSVTAMDGTASNDVYAVGGGGSVLHFNGSAWTLVTTLPVSLRAIYVAASNSIFVAGAFGLIYHYDGAHWSPIRAATSDIVAMGGSGDVVFMLDAEGTSYRLLATAPL